MNIQDSLEQIRYLSTFGFEYPNEANRSATYSFVSHSILF